MKPIRGFLAFIVALSLLTSCQTTSNEPGTSQIDWSDREHRAAQFVLALVEGDYSIAAEAFSSDMQRQLGVKGLKSAWDSVIQQAGAFEAIVSEDTLPHDEYDIREVTSDHATRGVVTRIVFSDDDKVAGLFFSYTDKSEGRDMSPADRGAYTDYPVTVGEGTGFPLAGVLSVPKSPQAKLPAVVLVHGSGPQDMDETAYGITVFKDIAEYLAANGVVVLRYDKRTFAHGSKFVEQFGDEYTVYDESIEDALLARDLLADNENVDPDRIYVLGHSLGGMLTPRILSYGGFAGGIIMAGSLRSLLDIIYDQNHYFIDLMDVTEAERSELYAEVDASREACFGLPEDYCMDMDSHPAKDYLLESSLPVLVLQGDKDFQVTVAADYSLYEELSHERQGMDLHLYANLSHMFTVSTMETPTTDDYIAGSKVDDAPLADILDWLLARP